MPSDLSIVIDETPMVDSHEHLPTVEAFTNDKPDLIKQLFDNYIMLDLVCAGADPDALKNAVYNPDGKIEDRWAIIEPCWQHCQLTGFGRGVQLIANLVFNIPEINLEALIRAETAEVAQCTHHQYRSMLQQRAGLDHVQIDDFQWKSTPDPVTPDFFLYDLAFLSFANGDFDIHALQDLTDIEVKNTTTLRQALESLFAKCGPQSIAIKSQHAYLRTLAWQEHSDAEIEPLLHQWVKGQALDEPQRIALGDWCIGRGAELCEEYSLPFKLHTGYLGGNNQLRFDTIRPALLTPLLERYPNVNFVLMHNSSGHEHELLAMAKHYTNVYADMCWAWSINPRIAGDFLRNAIQSVPIHKILGFGADAFQPAAALAYAQQARTHMKSSLQAAVDAAEVTEKEAVHIAHRIMHQNQYDFFDIESTRLAQRLTMGL